jgi:glycosyltransferase involved in cell wall biosynthesis
VGFIQRSCSHGWLGGTFFMKGVLYDSRWVGNHGIGRFAGEVQQRLPDLVPFQSRRQPWHPLDPALLGATLRGLSPKVFFSPGYNSPVGWPGSFIFTLHDLHHLRVRENSNLLKRSYYQYVIKPACHKSAAVLTVSEYSRREIAEWAKVDEQKIVNVGNGVGAPFGPTGRRHEPGYPYLLYVGSRKPHKNVPRLLQAYSVSGVRKDVRLVLSGNADKETVSRIERLGLRDHIVFNALDSTDTLAEAYRGAMGFLFPSLYEGFGLPPLEALACGIPVLTSDVCSLPEVVGDAAILVKPQDVEEIAEGIRRMVCDSTLRMQLREKGLRRSKLFSWQETARRTSEVIEFVLGQDCAWSRRARGICA